MELSENLVPEDIRDDHPPGAICIATAELSRYPMFIDAMLNVLRPSGTRIFMHAGLNVAANFNAGIRRMMNDKRLQWVWIMGDDHAFDSMILLQLLERQLDIVVPLVVRRQAPFIPVVFKQGTEDTPIGQLPPWKWSELPAHGVHEVYMAGSAGMLIRRHVLETIPDPWFEMGKLGSDRANEDTYFCEKVQAAGLKIYADTDVQMAHWTPMALWPARTQDGKWTVGIEMGQGVKVMLPAEALENMMRTTKEEWTEQFTNESTNKGGKSYA